MKRFRMGLKGRYPEEVHQHTEHLLRTTTWSCRFIGLRLRVSYQFVCNINKALSIRLAK